MRIDTRIRTCARRRPLHCGTRRLVIALCSLLLITTLTACHGVGWVSHVLAGDPSRTHQIKALYKGLENKRFAVLVDADDHTRYVHPHAVLDVSRTVTLKLVEHVRGAVPIDPHQIAQFQREHPFWQSLPYGRLIEHLAVDRLVLIDLVEYTTHEKGNPHVRQGTIVARVGTLEAEADDPNNFVFLETVKAQFPPHRPIGLLDSDDRTIQLETLRRFAISVGHLFFDHQQTVDDT